MPITTAILIDHRGTLRAVSFPDLPDRLQDALAAAPAVQQVGTPPTTPPEPVVERYHPVVCALIWLALIAASAAAWLAVLNLIHPLI